MKKKSQFDNSFAWVKLENLCTPLNWKHLFGNDHSVEIDLGAGDGGFITSLAQQQPHKNFLAVERLLGRARKIVRQVHRGELSNLRVLQLEMGYMMQYLIPPASISVFHLMFPDPWPKRRHQRKRLVQASFVENVVKALKSEGEFRFTTDHSEYFEQACSFFDACEKLRRVSLWEPQQDPKTEFQDQFEKEGRKIYQARWQR